MRNNKPQRWETVPPIEKVGKFGVPVIRQQSDKGKERWMIRCVRDKLTQSHPDWARKVFSRDTEDKTMKQLAFEHAFRINAFLTDSDPDNIHHHEYESLKTLYAKM